MTEQAAPEGPRLATRLWLAHAALLWERVWPAAWPALCVLVVFAILALLDLLPVLPFIAHAALLGVFAAALMLAVLWGVRNIRRSTRPDAARRRIEQASGLAHRPLAALADQPSAPLDPGAAALWAAHQQRMAAASRRLRIGWPAAGLARYDPWGVRSVLAILVLLAVVDAGGDWRDRVTRALVPSLDGGAAGTATSFDLWLTPPEYTGLPPQFLRPGDNTATAAAPPIQVAVGSALLAQVHGGGTVPQLKIDEHAQPFDAVDKTNFRVETTLRTATQLTLTQGNTVLGHWPIAITPDNPPTIAFAQPPKPTPRAALRLDYRAADDYGVEGVKAVIRREGDKSGEKIELDIPLPGVHQREAAATSYHDLSPHPWAGLPVEIRLIATDALGQNGVSEPVRLNLPERQFRNPVARAIIDQRKELARDAASAPAVSEILGDLNTRPALYRDDAVVYLALHMAQERLQQKPDKEAITAIEQLLWDTALRVEDGNMSVAERDLRRLQQQLQEALAKGAPDAEIEQLMKELREAMDRYLQALAEDMQRNPQDQGQPVDPSKMLTSRDLQRMLDRARDMARSGARDQAREMLSQLQNMLENLRTARPGQGQQQQGSSQAQQTMRGLQQLMQQQQRLLDRSFRAQRQTGRPDRQGQQGQRGQQPGQQQQGQQPGDQAGQPGDDQGDAGEMGDAAGQQEGLRHMLGEMMRRLGDGMGDIPEPFGRAERAMRDAAGALQQSRPGQAIGPQTEALDQLQQAARDLAEQMQKQLGNNSGDPGDDQAGATDRDPGERSERDPFGRPLSNGGTYDRGDVKIPDQSILQKSRQILDELRRRAGDRSRPEIELDYIERLLKRF